MRVTGIVLLLLLCCWCILPGSSGKSKEGSKSKEKASNIVYRLQVTGQNEFQLKRKQEPCAVLIKYCQDVSSAAGMGFKLVFDQIYDTVIEQLIKLWESLKLHKELKVDERLFVRCEPVAMDSTLERRLNAQTKQVTAASSVRRQKTLLGFLRKAVEDRDPAALKEFNTQRPLYKLTDMERFELYKRAIVLLPSNSFMIDQFGLSLMAVGRTDLAQLLFTSAVKRGIWGDVMQRPVSKYVKNLRALPWHDPSDYPFLAELEGHIDTIRTEFDAARRDQPSLFTEEQENLHEGGNWTELRLKSSGNGWLASTNAYFPKTVDLLRGMDQDFTSIKFSSILPGTHIRPHTGPTNERLRIHLTLYHHGGARIRVNDTWHSWPNGKAIVFDDSWEHEVVNEGDHERTVLILDIWHPQLPAEQRIVH